MEKREKDHPLIANAPHAAQVKVCLTLHCFEAQLRVQSIVAVIVGKGEDGTLSTVRGNMG